MASDSARFYSQRDWDNGVYDDVEPESEPKEPRGDAGNCEGQEGLAPSAATVVETSQGPDAEEAVEHAGIEGEGNTASAAGEAASPSGSSAGLSSARPSEAGVHTASGIFSGSRQTSLAFGYRSPVAVAPVTCRGTEVS